MTLRRTIAVVVIVATLLSIYVLWQHGCALFVLLPFAIGFGLAAILAIRGPVRLEIVCSAAASTALLLTIVLVLHGDEWLICIAVVASIYLVLVLLGAVIGYQMFHSPRLRKPARAAAERLV